MNKIKEVVIDLFEELNSKKVTNPRNTVTKSKKVAKLDVDPLYPLLDFGSIRPFNWKYFVGELVWYLKGENTTDFIKNFSSFWENIKNSDGTINSNYGTLLLNPHPSSNGHLNQLEWVFNSLANDRDTRQAVAFLNSPHFQVKGNKDFVCTMYLNFFIEDNKLSMKVQMRSNDLFFGLSYDAPWFSLLHQCLFLNLKNVYDDLELGTYYHCSDDIHFYDRHFSLVDNIIENREEILNINEKFELSRPLFNFYKNLNGEYVLDKAYTPFTQALISDVENSDFSNKDQEFWKSKFKSFLKP